MPILGRTTEKRTDPVDLGLVRIVIALGQGEVSLGTYPPRSELGTVLTVEEGWLIYLERLGQTYNTLGKHIKGLDHLFLRLYIIVRFGITRALTRTL